MAFTFQCISSSSPGEEMFSMMQMKNRILVVAFAAFQVGFSVAFVAPSRVAPPSSCLSSSQLCAKKSATFGMGCFWAPSEALLKTDGVIDTVAGYTGNPEAGSKAPSYDNVCFGRQWVEGVRVDYDDEIVSYNQLLDAFFEAQEPQPGSRQYASIIFPHDAVQEKVAKEWLEAGTREGRRRKDGIPVSITQLEPLSPFFAAEGYHQRYWQKFRPRIAACIALLVVSSGRFDSLVPPDFTSTLHTAANTAVLLGCAYVILERNIDTKVVELPP